MAEKIYSAEEVRKRTETLPEEVRKLLYSEEMYNIVKKIGEKYKLHIDQWALLEAETGQVMLGFIEAKDFSNELTAALNIGRAQADAIAGEVNDQLFAKIRESMKKTDAQTTTKLPVVSAPTPPQPPKPPSPPPPPPPPVPKPPVLAPAAPPPVPKPPTLVPPIPPKPAVPTPPTSPPAPKPPAIPAADVALTQKTVSSPPPAPNTSPAKPEPPKPGNYKADPYREPPE